MGVKPPMAWAKFFYHVIWITVVFRSNNSRWLLWKFSAIRVTRWLFLASKLHKIQFWPPLTPLGSLRRSSRPSSQLGRGKPPPHSLPSSTPSASRCRRRILGIYGASTLTPPLTISGYATANPICWTCKNSSHECAADCEHCVTQSSTEQFW